jgi:exodeoxyribonuclease V alpha subunit
VSNIFQRVDQKFDSTGTKAMLDKYFAQQADLTEIDWQREAAKSASQQSFTMITGGPGTGKTTTVLKILALLQELNDCNLEISLAAPTGKAAMRLQQSLNEGKLGLGLTDQRLLDSIPDSVSTLHRLLGPINQSTQFRHNRDKPLSCDLLVVDESSMIDLAMMSKLLESLHPKARLILLGDKDQLASVESGAVLNDLCSGLPNQTVELKKTWRFSGPIKDFALAINYKQASESFNLLIDEKTNDQLCLIGEDFLEHIYQQYLPYVKQIKSNNDPAEAMAAFAKFQVLAAVRQGEFGVEGINRNLEKRLQSSRMQTQLPWYHGKPVMITRNDPSLGLFNGDIGICLYDSKESQLRVWFEESSGSFRAMIPARLPQHETVFAMTIHKSQGSEFERVMLVLPDKPMPILSRELLYTGVTRAKNQVDIATTESVFNFTVDQQVVRNSGINYKIQAATIEN